MDAQSLTVATHVFRSNLPRVSHLLFPGLHPRSRPTAMALSSLEFGDLSIHDMDGYWLLKLLHQLDNMAW